MPSLSSATTLDESATAAPARPERAASRATIVPPAGGAPVRAFGNQILFKLTSEETAGAFTLGLAEVPAGSDGPPPHVHEAEDELFLVVQGAYRVFADGEWTEVGPDSVVYLPRGVVHTFRVVGAEPGRHWVFTTPGGFERYFSRCAEVFAVPGPPDFARIAAINAEHGLRFQH